MKNNRKKIIAFLALLTLLIATLMPMVSADEAYVEWTLSDDEQTLTDGTVSYTYYGKVSYELSPDNVYTYAAEVYLQEEGLCSVRADPTVSNVVWLETGAWNYLYATDEGRIALDRWFVNREIGAYCVWDNDDVAELSSSLADAMDAAVLQQAAMRTVSVMELEALPRYEITAHDSQGLFSTPYGVVYEWEDGAYYYVNYWLLDNSYFDANGKFSYREGTVTLTLLDESLASQFATVIGETHYYDVEYQWESDGLPEVPMVVFWLFFIFVGFLLPIPFLVLGIVFANMQKWGRPQYWYSLTILGGLWMLLSALLAVLLLCC